MYWLFLALAIMFELLGTTMMKLSEGLTKLWPSVGMFISYVLCFSIFSLALKKIPVSVAYAIWSAAGILIISCIGIMFFKESVNPPKLVAIFMIIVGVVILNLSGASH